MEVYEIWKGLAFVSPAMDVNGILLVNSPLVELFLQQKHLRI